MITEKTFRDGNRIVTVRVEETTPVFNRPLFNRPVCGCEVMPPFVGELPTFVRPTRLVEPILAPQPCREPDGFDAHIDNPNPSNPRYWGWNGRERFVTDKIKYENALDAVKRCNWPNREPIGAVNAPRFVRPFARPLARPLFEPTRSCGLFGETDPFDEDWL